MKVYGVTSVFTRELIRVNAASADEARAIARDLAGDGYDIVRRLDDYPVPSTGSGAEELDQARELLS